MQVLGPVHTRPGEFKTGLEFRSGSGVHTVKMDENLTGCTENTENLTGSI